MPLRILADENIPCADDAFGTLGTVETRPGRTVTADDIRDVDVLLVRSVTDVGPDLLGGSSVRFVGSATIGTDHIDRDYLDAEGIAFAHAPASNADSVADYVTASILHLAVTREVDVRDLTVGIVGVGNIGGRLARRLPALGASVRLNDPPRRRSDDPGPGVSDEHTLEPLEDVLAASDIITLHTPLTTGGPDPTHHLFSEDRLRHLNPGTWLFNTSRGAVVDNAALRRVYQTEGISRKSPLGALVLDVWEDEPEPSPGLVAVADLATPHVAGYAFDGKIRGTWMLYEALCEHLGEDPRWSPESVLTPDDPDALRCTPPDASLPHTLYLDALARQVYDVTGDDDRMRPYLEQPASERGSFFSELRKTYPIRREMQTHVVSSVPDARTRAVADGLTIEMEDAT